MIAFVVYVLLQIILGFVLGGERFEEERKLDFFQFLPRTDCCVTFRSFGPNNVELHVVISDLELECPFHVYPFWIFAAAEVSVGGLSNSSSSRQQQQQQNSVRCSI